MNEKTVHITHFDGMPGSGKNTQAEMVALHTPGSVIIDTGDIIRKSRQVDSEFHVYYQLLEPFLDGSQKGELIPDSVMIVIARAEIRKKIESGVVNIFTTGYPRTPDQEEDMLALASELQSEGIRLEGQHILLEVGPDLARKRASERILIAEARGDVPRKDDLAIEKRLQEFETYTVPMLDRLRHEERVIVVDGVGSIDQVGRWTLEALSIVPNEDIIARAALK